MLEEIRGTNKTGTRAMHVLEGSLHITVLQVDAPAGIGHHPGGEPELDRIQC